MVIFNLKIKSIFKSLKNLHSGRTNPHSHQRCMRIPFLHLPPAFAICVLFDDSHSDWCEVISCGFDLRFTDDQCYWTPFHMPVVHLHFLFGKMSFNSAHFFGWVVCFLVFGIELCDLFIFVGYNPLFTKSLANISPFW